MSVKDKFGKVAVLCGGFSGEREVSLHSGQQVHQGLVSAGVDAHLVDVGHDIVRKLEAEQFDRVFSVLHGRGGEDGTMQALLEYLKLPYCSSGVAASALAMDKVRTKWIWQANQLPTPLFRLIKDEKDLEVVKAKLTLPIAVKPVHEGSSLGVIKVTDYAQLKAAYLKAKECNDHIMAEEWIEGDEYTVTIVGHTLYPSIKISTPNHEFYDYEAKYTDHSTVYECPSNLTGNDEFRLQRLSMRAFRLLGCRGWGRVDVMRAHDGTFFLIEVNTLPGMTETSLVPQAALAAGVSFPALVVKILETSLTR
jgi:D-alanine-D-alanine ligase